MTRGQKNLAEIRERGTALAEEVVVKDGVRGLSARGLAKKLGVSVGTLYNAFRDLDGVVRAVNNRSAELLSDRLRAAVDAAKPDPRSRLVAMGHAYFDFAVDEPERWWALFEYRPDVNASDDGEGYQKDLMEFLIRTGGSDPETDPDLERYVMLWASVHGLVSLANRPTIVAVPADAARRYLEELVDAAMTVFRIGKTPTAN